MKKTSLFLAIWILFFFSMIENYSANSKNFTMTISGNLTPDSEMILTIGTSGLNETSEIIGYQIDIKTDSTKMSLISCIDVTGKGTPNITNEHIENTWTEKITNNQNLIKCTYKIQKSVIPDTNLSIQIKNTSGFIMDNGSVEATEELTQNIKVKKVLSNINTLSLLQTNSGTLSPTFNKDITSYTVDVKSSVGTVVISAKPTEENAEVEGIGAHTLKYGVNTIPILVTSESGNKKTYTLKINRPDNRSTDTTLKSLSIKNQNLKEKFDPKIKKYTIEVDNEINNIIVLATPTDTKSKVLITGATTLIEGKQNRIYITVTSEKGNKEDYIVDVYRNLKQEVNKEPEKPIKENPKSEEPENEKTNKIILYVLSGATFLLLIGVGIYVIKSKK